MAVKAGTAYVDIEGDFSALNKQVSSHFNKLNKSGGTGKKIGGSLRAGMGVGVTAAAGIAAVGVGALAGEVIKATKGWAAHQAIQRRTQAVIKSTGEAAGVSAKHVERMSDAIERQTGVDGDLIQSGANLLLTFTNVRNGVGKNNKVFDEATKTTVNMSKALGQDTKSSAIQLGKALNDPIKGITALSRVGVSFTDKQKDQIKALVESGDSMKAQKIILKELNKEFPKVKATPFERLVTVGRQIEDVIGKAVLPLFNKLVRKVLPPLKRIADEAADIFDDKNLSWGEKFKKLGEVVKREAGPLAKKLVDGIKEAKLDEKLGDAVAWASPKVTAAFKTVGKASAKAVWEGFKEAPLWAKVGGGVWLANKLGVSGPAAKGLFSWLTGGKGGGLLKKATPMPVFVTNPGFGVPGKPGAPAPVPTGSPKSPLGKGVDWVKRSVGKLPKGVRWGAGGLTIGITAALGYRELVNSQRGGEELPKLTQQLDALVAPSAQGNPREEQLKRITEALVDAEDHNDPTKLKAVSTELDKWAKANPNDTRAAQLGNIADEARRMSNVFKDVKPVEGFADSIRKNNPVIKRLSGNLREAKEKLHGLDRGSKDYRDTARDVREAQRKLNDKLIDMVPTTKEAKDEVKKLGINFSNLGGDVYTTSSLIAAATNQVLSGLGADTIKFSLKMSQKYKDYSAGPGGDVVQHQQRGGPISGSGVGDKIAALLEPGEYVVNKKAVKKVGRRTLDRLNFGDAPRFQAGGIVELLHPFNDPEGHGGSNSHLHVAMSTVAGIIALGKKLQKLGWLVGENPAFGGIQGRHATDGYHPKGLAIDVNWPNAAEEGAKIKAILPMLGGDLGALVQAAIPKIGKLLVDGPEGPMKDILVGSGQKMRGAAQKYIDKIASSMEGAEPGASLSATGNGADLMKSISKTRGWNFADWWALDAGESGHGTNLVNPTSSARLRGQFLDMNYGKYGPGSDPAQNPSMGQQIQSMAMYIAERYGNPTNAYHQWLSRSPHWYQRGGVVGSLMSLFKSGGDVGAVGAKTKNSSVFNLKHHKSHKPSDHKSQKMIKSLGRVGATGLQAVMDRLKQEADKYADWAERANNITDTDALQSALNAEMTRRGGRSNMSDQELLKLFPAADQDAFIQQWLHGNASFNGGIQSDWLTQELSQLLAWRNNLIDNPPIFQALLDAAKAAYQKVKAEIKRITADIEAFVKRRDKAREVRDNQQQTIDEIKNEIEKEKKKKPSKARNKRIDKLNDRLFDHRRRRNRAEEDIRDYNSKIDNLQERRRNARRSAQTLGGDNGEPGDGGDGSEGRISKLTESITDMGSSLIDVHGLGTTMQKFVAPSQFQLGALGGTILGVQNEILGISRNPARASAEEAGAEPTDAEDQTKEILAQLLREANLRTAVSEAQFDVFRNLPFGGSFKTGGMVPGPLGSPRMILAHGGEVVIPNDSDVPNVALYFAPGTEWLRNFVDVRVEQTTRTQARSSDRRLPGRPGVLR